MARQEARQFLDRARPRAERRHGRDLVLVGSLLIAALTARGQSVSGDPSGGQAQPKSWAVLIGIEKYQKVRPLQYTNNDVQALSEVLQSRGGLRA